jgi:hypothetical protein
MSRPDPNESLGDYLSRSLGRAKPEPHAGHKYVLTNIHTKRRVTWLSLGRGVQADQPGHPMTQYVYEQFTRMNIAKQDKRPIDNGNSILTIE